MTVEHHGYLRIRPRSQAALARGAAWGLVGGLVGTIVMDLVLMGVLSAVGLRPATAASQG